MFDDLWVERNLPEPFQAIFGNMSGLHHTVSAPEIPGDFSFTPGQLLERVRQLSTEPVNQGEE
jgi:hypothetical protein